jgi:hypothetical protein
MNSLLPCPDRLYLFAGITFILGFLSYSCEKEPEPFYSNGVITGTVQLRDGTDPANTKIIAHGPYGSSSVSSDSEGEYKLQGLGNGTYEIEFTKANYGTIREQGIQVFGNDTIFLSVRLYKKADYKMPKLGAVLYYHSYQQMDEHSIAIQTDIPLENTEVMQIKVFVNDNKDVSYTNYKHCCNAYASVSEDATVLMVVPVNPQVVNSEGKYLFNSGQTLYLIAYVCNIQEEIAEFSEYYGLPIFSTVDEQQHSRVIEFKAP